MIEKLWNFLRNAFFHDFFAHFYLEIIILVSNEVLGNNQIKSFFILPVLRRRVTSLRGQSPRQRARATQLLIKCRSGAGPAPG